MTRFLIAPLTALALLTAPALAGGIGVPDLPRLSFPAPEVPTQGAAVPVVPGRPAR